MYLQLNFHYNSLDGRSQEEQREKIGSEIFNLIMPYAQHYDPRLTNLIPPGTLQHFKFDFDKDNKIKGWTYKKDDTYSAANLDDSSSQSQESESDDSAGRSDSNIESFVAPSDIEDAQQAQIAEMRPGYPHPL